MFPFLSWFDILLTRIYCKFPKCICVNRCNDKPYAPCPFWQLFPYQKKCTRISVHFFYNDVNTWALSDTNKSNRIFSIYLQTLLSFFLFVYTCIINIGIAVLSQSSGAVYWTTAQVIWSAWTAVPVEKYYISITQSDTTLCCDVALVWPLGAIVNMETAVRVLVILSLLGRSYTRNCKYFLQDLTVVQATIQKWSNSVHNIYAICEYLLMNYVIWHGSYTNTVYHAWLCCVGI